MRLNTVPPTHRPLLCQPNHDKHSAAPGSAAFGLVVSGLAVCCLGLLATVDCCGFSIGWFGGVGPVSCHLCQILPQQVSEFLAAVSGKRVLRRWVRRLQFGSCRIQAASGPPSRHLSPQVSPRQRTRRCQTRCGESHGLVHAIPDRCNNQPIRLDNIN